jgi:hypothetical protein
LFFKALPALAYSLIFRVSSSKIDNLSCRIATIARIT